LIYLVLYPGEKKSTILAMQSILQFTSFPIHSCSSTTMSNHGIENPNPAMQLRYLAIVDLQSSCALSDLLNSMHSSLAAFSSLHTQHGLGFVEQASVLVLRVVEVSVELFGREAMVFEELIVYLLSTPFCRVTWRF